MSQMLDLLIIGAGLAGLSAALVAAEAGLRVRVLAKGMGVTHWHAGTVDLLGYLPGCRQPLAQPLGAIGDLPPDHPYRRFDAQHIADALRHFQTITDAAGLRYGSPGAGQNILLPSPLGAARPAYLAPQAQLAGDLQRNEPMLIVGLHNGRDFFPKLIAANLAKLGHTARAELIDSGVITERRDFNTMHLAEALDQAAALDRLIRVLQRLIQPGERIGFPAILGLKRHYDVWQSLQERLAAPVFEIPTLPPSMPGIRLFQALRNRLLKLGVRVEIGMEVVGFESDSSHIRSVTTATSARPLTHRAGHFLLATGGVLGGGFNSDHHGRFWEVVFDLPLTIPQERSRWFHHHFLHEAGHPVFAGGVAVNDQWQPVGPAGEPVFQNLWAAGSLLAHADPIRQRSLEGIAIATGIAAAHALIQQR
jgi:glycerol-3-phosphate dehydrogenase subunit B